MHAILSMHLGGLTLAVALWRASKSKAVVAEQQAVANSRPQVLVLGGGGGAIPRTIAAALPGSSIEVVEPCADTRLAARKCFGLAELEEEQEGRFKLHGGCGVEYMQSVPEGSVDVLIIDAASGQHDGLHAPPVAFRSDAFWSRATRALNPAGAAFGLNLVGNPEALVKLRQTIVNAMPGWSMRSISPPPGGLPDQTAIDQRLLFGVLGSLANAAELKETGFCGLGGRLMKEEELWLPHWDRHSDL
eukprot:gnl/TRDRNA2_/TRDRNA2_157638_c0_seq1.p1 gnl/TRDRNA2_/TRDRNA2_157638_c0~~gnl/TRDRNA2_/TRDRNA2_157638_c0_seq1.p1  ORF type:complete len:246 (+),score=35.07 gnl/TRDRNA2_/TRDRNA2_157638_c0_seq1:1-738(+)